MHDVAQAQPPAMAKDGGSLPDLPPPNGTGTHRRDTCTIVRPDATY